MVDLMKRSFKAAWSLERRRKEMVKSSFKHHLHAVERTDHSTAISTRSVTSGATMTEYMPGAASSNRIETEPSLS